MSYVEQAALNLSDRRLIELTDSESATGTIDTTLLAGLLVESEAIVNGILAPLGVTPFADGSVPSLVQVCTAWIWTYRIYRHREVMEIPQSVKDDYERALQMLKDMVAGVISLGDSTGDDPSTAAATSQVPTVISSDPRGWTHRDRGVT